MAATTKYPPELRQRAVQMYQVADPKPAIRQMARDLDVHPETLRNWIRQDEAARNKSQLRAVTAEQKEITRLRKENAELRRTNEILKAASAFFAQEIDPAGRRG